MILIDTGPLVALCDKRDANYKRASREFQGMSGQGLLVCPAVLVECCFHLTEHFQRELLRELLDDMDARSPSDRPESEIWPEVFDWLGKYADHSPDWTDGLLVVLSGKDDRHRVWTHDREFRTVWRRLDGSPVPLAVELD